MSRVYAQYTNARECSKENFSESYPNGSHASTATGLGEAALRRLFLLSVSVGQAVRLMVVVASAMNDLSRVGQCMKPCEAALALEPAPPVDAASVGRRLVAEEHVLSIVQLQALTTASRLRFSDD